MPNSFRILGRGLMMLRNHWEVFGGLFLIYALLNSMLALTSLLNINLAQTKADLEFTNQGQGSQIGTGIVLAESLLSGGVGVAGGIAGAYQTALFIIMSLAIVWALRQLAAGSKIRVRDALYNSSYPLVQVLLIMVVLSIQILPAAIGASLITSLLIGGVVVVAWQQYVVGFVVFLLMAWSVYLLISSVIALYIATLPGMTPLKALRSAKDIVRYRRAEVLRKLLFLPFILMVVGSFILVPLSLLLPFAATLVFFIMGMVILPIAHAYLYTLYRELIK